ncbi:hypothetical protein VCHA43P273_90143 [Vibrio chagasii]|uniref:hypothetical protein n=1 Tax=Vibrio mediterranei TaxID=689 RepID=UPI001EFCB6C3|nr:hypothetical protein [Vibrio mediterranei]MCG9664209.1 hypothetical protein [Vibrio mediterranei]CAH7436923.1 hypothetical protein VCHA43P273_90143 [Vibrio chagasii]CAK2979129.1 hypothetical protein VCRA219O19_60021 [Vibrio crassostreae]
MKEPELDKLDLNESEYGNSSSDINKLEVTTQKANTQEKRLKALDELSMLDQEMGRYDE